MKIHSKLLAAFLALLLALGVGFFAGGAAERRETAQNRLGQGRTKLSFAIDNLEGLRDGEYGPEEIQSDIASNKVVVVRFSDTYAPCPGCIVCKRLKRFGNTICLISDNDGGRAFDDIKPADFTWLGVVVGKYSDDF